MTESSFEERIAALKSELNAAQIEYKLEKLRSQSALERIVRLETQVCYIIANLQHDFEGNIENINILTESRHTTSSSIGTALVDLWSGKNIPEGLPSPFEVDFMGQSVQEDEENALDKLVTIEVEDDVEELEDETDVAYDEPVTLLETMELDNEEKDVATQEREIVRDAIKRFSSSNPRKWVDSCKKELETTYNIKIGSSSLSTRKHRDK